MKRAYLIPATLILVFFSAAFPPRNQATAKPARLLGFFPVGSFVELRPVGTMSVGYERAPRRFAEWLGSYEVRIATDKEVEQWNEEMTRYEKDRAVLDAKRHEIEKREEIETRGKVADRNTVEQRQKLMVDYGRLRRPGGMMYRVVAKGDDYVELETIKPGRQDQARFILPITSIHHLNITGEPEPPAPKKGTEHAQAAKSSPKPNLRQGPHAIQSQSTQSLSFSLLMGSHRVYRAKVPGGWLIVVEGSPGRNGTGVTFYPDPNHTWDGKSLP